MKEITGTEFVKQIRMYSAMCIVKDVSEFSDCIELEWRLPDGTVVLRKTEQENYDEFQQYPSTIKYFKA